MNSQTYSLNLFMLAMALVFCISNCREASENSHDNTTISDNGLSHATGFEAEIHDGFRRLTVYDPWQGATSITFEYILVDHEMDLPDPMPDGILVRTPVSSVICLSTTHLAMLDFIDASSAVSAVSGSRYIFNEEIRERISRGELPDIGYDMNLDYEQILVIQPDIIFAYGVGAETGSYISRLQSLGIKVVVIGEYLEGSPLAQAEWVKFFAHFFNRQEMAEEKFQLLEKEYEKLTTITSDLSERPLVLSGLPWRESWFVPGGNSLFSALISDAGGEYIFNNVPGRDNFPVGLETVFNLAVGARYWINTGTAFSLKDIEQTDARLAGLPPFRTGSVYNNNLRTRAAGGNDYWESGIVNPHIVLADLISILHPGLLESHHLVYYRKL
jgi:iron complex transport system substrate-binding protein